MGGAATNRLIDVTYTHDLRGLNSLCMIEQKGRQLNCLPLLFVRYYLFVIICSLLFRRYYFVLIMLSMPLFSRLHMRNDRMRIARW